MNHVIWRVKEAISNSNLQFSSKPILIGGRAMEYYDIRNSGRDIDFVKTDKDYRNLAKNIRRSKGTYMATQMWRLMHLRFGEVSRILIMIF